MKDIFKKKTAVLCGGFGPEREVSLRSGNNVYKVLQNTGINAEKIDVDDNLIETVKERKIELVYNVLHGSFGEDGSLPAIMDFLKIPYTGPDQYQSVFCFDKLKTKDILKANHIKTPRGLDLFGYSTAAEITAALQINNLSFPLIHKPVRSGSSVEVQIIKDQTELESVLHEKFKNNTSSAYLLEKFIYGRELTAGICRYKNQILVLPVIELKPENEYYDYEAKYTAGKTDFIIPAKLDKAVLYNLKELVTRIYKIFQFTAVIRVDLILDPDNILHILEVNTVPGMTDTSDIPMMLNKQGIKMESFLIEELTAGIKKQAFF
ncbi:MAG TPA: D-alanine--D-alanine ligase [Spirochaetota bacterium]|nr:D-alanine--D-alanine ligase [Spirochaetota bacterium]